MQRKKIRLNPDPNQRSVLHMFAKQLNETQDESTDNACESKQHVLIDLSMQQVESETGIDWTI